MGMENEIQAAAAKKENSHRRYNCHGKLLDPATSLHENEPYGKGHENRTDGRADSKDLLTGLRNCVGLGRAADKKSRKAQGSTIEQSK